jgi:ubiquinone/menaquinone biosynthesis C-methylase UbiE
MKKKYGQCFDVSEKNNKYLKVSILRAKNKLPEMEVAKAYGDILKKYVKKNSRVLDAGCLAGHFYTTLKKRFEKKKIFYTGIDPWKHHIDAAKKIWSKEKNVNFKKCWLQKLPFKNNQFDISICCNVLTHIPEIIKPIKELLRTTKETIIIRTPIHDKSYRIQLVLNSKWFKFTNIRPENEFDNKGNPRVFEYFDVHSKDYFSSVIKRNYKKCKITFIKDTFFNAKKINNKFEKSKKINSTKIDRDGNQITDLLIVPHYFVIIEKNI